MDSLLREALADIDADYADIRVERAESTSVSCMGPEFEHVGSTFTLGGCVRACVRGAWGFAAFNRIEDARTSAQEALTMARIVGHGETLLAPVKPVSAVLKSTASDPTRVSLEEKCGLVRRYNDIMLHAEGIVTTSTLYRDMKRTVWLLTSEGTSIERETVYAGVNLSAIARDGANVQRGIRSFGDQRGYDTVLGHEKDADDAVRTARDLIAAPKVNGGMHKVILDPQLAGVFAHEAFGHLSESDFVYENPKAGEMMKLGRRFGPDILNIVDDGSLDGENGYTPYDDEGTPAGRTSLIKDGILVGRLHSRETAGKMSEPPTGNARALNAGFRPLVRMTNTFIDRGESSFESMLDAVGDGIYACGFLGGNTDLERFTFSSAYAYRIENGRITTPVRDVILSGNVFDTLNRVIMIGDDLRLFGGLGGCGKGGQSPLPVSDGSPHILIDGVLVG